MHEMNTQNIAPELFEEWNEKMAAKYPSSHVHSANLLLRWVDRKRVQRITAALPIAPESTIVDLGCGVGEVLEQIPQGQLTGMDFSRESVRKARLQLQDRASILHGDIEKADTVFGQDVFDVVICSEVIEHVLHPEKALSVMRTLLKPGGVAIVTVPNEYLINRVKAVLASVGLFQLLFGKNVPRRMNEEWHLHMFTYEELTKLCTDAGFTICRKWGVPYRIFPLRYVLELKLTKLPDQQ